MTTDASWWPDPAPDGGRLQHPRHPHGSHHPHDPHERRNDVDLDRTGGSTASPHSTSSGFGRLLVAVYAILALAATVRGAYQLVAHGSEAPLAYSLSLAAGIVYVVATLALAKGTGRWRTVAWVTVSIELVGVLTVGLLTIVDAGDFPEATVWSSFGQGYGYVPLVLPLVGLFWLWRTRPTAAASAAASAVPSVPSEPPANPAA